jgi:hypothetical protein
VAEGRVLLMKVFGSREPVRSDEDEVALARLQAIAGRFKAGHSPEPEVPEESEVSVDPEASEDSE